MRILSFWLAALLAVPASAYAQDDRGPAGAIMITSPEQAVATALASSPTLRGAGAAQQAVRGDALQAPLRPNPDFSVAVENFGGIGGRGAVRGGRAVETTVGVSQRIELGGKRGARIGLAGEANTVAALDFELARLDLAREVVTALADAVAAARLVDIELERARLADETLRIARGRVEAGRDPLVQQRRAEVTRTTALIAAERARREAEVALRNLTVLLGVPQIVKAAIEATKEMNAEDRYAALTATAQQVMNTMPPRENPRVNKSLDSVHASGPLGRAHCVIHGNSNYKQTGLLQAYAAYSLLQQPPHRVGFASGCQAFGHHELLGVLRTFGLVSSPVLTTQD